MGNAVNCFSISQSFGIVEPTNIVKEEKDSDMAEQHEEHPQVVDEVATEGDTTKIRAIAPTPPPHADEPLAQRANTADTAGTEDMLAPTLKMPALKKTRPLSTEPVIAPLHGSVSAPAPTAHLQATPLVASPINNDYDYTVSEVDVDIVTMLFNASHTPAEPPFVPVGRPDMDLLSQDERRNALSHASTQDELSEIDVDSVVLLDPVPVGRPYMDLLSQDELSEIDGASIVPLDEAHTDTPSSEEQEASNDVAPVDEPEVIVVQEQESEADARVEEENNEFVAPNAEATDEVLAESREESEGDEADEVLDEEQPIDTSTVVDETTPEEQPVHANERDTINEAVLVEEAEPINASTQTEEANPIDEPGLTEEKEEDFVGEEAGDVGEEPEDVGEEPRVVSEEAGDAREESGDIGEEGDVGEDKPSPLPYDEVRAEESGLSSPEPLVLDDVDTPFPRVSVEEYAAVPVTPAPPITPVPSVPVTPASGALPGRTAVAPSKKKRFSIWRIFGGMTLITVLLVSALLFSHELTTPHLYANALDPSTGNIKAQQDFGSYQDATTLTAPMYVSSSLLLGIHTSSTRNGESIVVLKNAKGKWRVNGQFAAPTMQGSFSTTTEGYILLEDAHKMQVWTTDGQLLWQLYGDQPTRGTHPFHAISDDQFVYTVKSVAHSEVAAYTIGDGKQRWIQTLNDTLAYSPPFLLDRNTLYIASDHNIVALNSLNGKLLWEKPYPSRTLLLQSDGQRNTLIAAGVQGLVALDPTNGSLRWSFRGQASNNTTLAQLYQATLATSSPAKGAVVYTSGIVWKMPQVQEQVWLYAVQASTGTLLWSQQIGSGFTSADAGRTLKPEIDTTNGLVLLQQQIDLHDQRVLAYDALTGTQRWSTEIHTIIGSSPLVLATKEGGLVLFTTSADSSLILHSLSLSSLLTLLLMIASGVSLFLFVLFSYPVEGLQSPIQAFLRAVGGLPHQVLRLWSHSRELFIAPLVLLIVGTSTLLYTQLNQLHESLYQVTARTGTTQWQHTNSPNSPSAQTLSVDTQGSMVINTIDNNLHVLQALDSNGGLRWQTFSSEGTFSLPTAAPQIGTLLVALSGHTALNYQFAPDDPAYSHALDHFLALSLFRRADGTLLWSSTVVYPDEQQQAVVLGTNTHSVYLSSTQTTATAVAGKSTYATQLFSINQATGTVEWRVFGPSEDVHAPHDNGTILLSKGQVFWQIAGVVYAIDSAVGQIAWRQPLVSDPPALLIQEEKQMTLTENALLLSRSDGVHALDVATGNLRWKLPIPSIPTAQSAAGILATNTAIIIYGNGQLQAFDIASKHPLWPAKPLTTIQRATVSADGKMLYLILLNTLANTAHTSDTASSSSLIALDIASGTIHWTFVPPGQAPFSNLSTNGIVYQNDILFTTICLSSAKASCTQERLYALDALTGTTLWKRDGASISDMHISQDGTTLVVRIANTAWNDLTTRF